MIIDTNRLDDPFKTSQMAGELELAGQSVTLLMERNSPK